MQATTAKDEEENEEGGLAAKHEDDPSELPKMRRKMRKVA